MPSQPLQPDISSQGTLTQNLQSVINPGLSLHPAELLASFQAQLEQARGEYAVRRYDVVQTLLDGILRLLPVFSEPASSSYSQTDFRLLEASVHTLRGRLLKDVLESMSAFRTAVSLFDRYVTPIAESPVQAINPAQGETLNVRIYTDYGIALYRSHRNEDAIRILSVVCGNGAAPAEAFGYLGYAEMTRQDLVTAEARLRTGLQLSPADPTMSYWLAHVLRLAGKPSEAAAAFCDAGIAAGNMKDFSSAGRCGLWALRMNPSSEAALRLAALAYRWLGRPSLALLVVRRFLKSQPSHRTAHGWEGILLRDCGKMEESIAILGSVHVESAEDVWILGEYVQSLLLAGRGASNEALNAAEQAVIISPDDQFLLRVQARVLMQRGAFELAVTTLQKVEKIAPASEDLAIELGEALISSGNLIEAQEHFAKAVIEYPRSAPAQFGLAFCFERQGEIKEALAHYRRSGRLDANYPLAFIQLLDLLLSQGRKEEAMDEIEDRLSGPIRYLALWRKALLLREENHWQAALECLEAAVAAGHEADAVQNWPAILIDYGDMLRQAGRFEQANNVYKQALAIDNNRVDALEAMAFYHCELAEFTQAQEYLERALQIKPMLPSLWDLKGWCLQHRGLRDEARNAYQQAVTLTEGRNSWYLKGLANVLLEFDKEKAQEIFLQILEQQKYQPDAEPVTGRPSGNVHILALLGWCNYRLGRYEEAVRLYQTVLPEASDMVPSFFDLGLTLLATGREELATKAYDRGYEVSQQNEPDRRRGQYYVALFDLADAMRHQLISSRALPTLEKLQGWLSSVGINPSELKWLPGNTATAETSSV